MLAASAACSEAASLPFVPPSVAGAATAPGAGTLTGCTPSPPPLVVVVEIAPVEGATSRDDPATAVLAAVCSLVVSAGVGLRVEVPVRRGGCCQHESCHECAVRKEPLIAPLPCVPCCAGNAHSRIKITSHEIRKQAAPVPHALRSARHNPTGLFARPLCAPDVGLAEGGWSIPGASAPPSVLGYNALEVDSEPAA